MKIRHTNARFGGRVIIAWAALVALFAGAAALRSTFTSVAAATIFAVTSRVHLEPHFTPGQVMRYEIDMHNVTKGHATGPVKDPEAASQLSQSTSVVVRLEVLAPATTGALPVSGSASAPSSGSGAGAKSAAPGSASASEGGNTRMRATYEHANATNESDAYDEQAEALAEQYRKLEGQSIEFTIGADGHISDLTGLDAILHDFSALASVRGWMSNLAPGSAFPKKGIAIGDKWHSEEPLPGAPLRGTVWRADSEYSRNDVCRASNSADGAAGVANSPPSAAHAPEGTPDRSAENRPAETGAASGNAAPNRGGAAGGATYDAADSCAVIITQFKILQTAPHGDLTPPDYLRNGLRTTGSWTGAGESMSMISLRTGLVVSVTQTSNQEMNFTIASASTASRLTYTGEVKSQSEITLLPEPLAVSR